MGFSLLTGAIFKRLKRHLGRNSALSSSHVVSCSWVLHALTMLSQEEQAEEERMEVDIQCIPRIQFVGHHHRSIYIPQKKKLNCNSHAWNMNKRMGWNAVFVILPYINHGLTPPRTKTKHTCSSTPQQQSPPGQLLLLQGIPKLNL